MAWIAPLVQIGTSMMGQQQAADAYNSQDKQARAMLAALNSIQLPDVEKQKLLLELPQIVGTYNPQLEQTYQLNPSAMEGVSTDPQLAQAQMNALQELQNIGQTGLTAVDEQALDQIRRQVSQEDQARQASILQNMAERGVAGSGMELAAKLKSSQTAADRASQEGMKQAALALQRRMEAVGAAGTLGGQMRGQEFGEKSDIAKAKDIFQQFNVQNQQAVQQRNTASQNMAQAQNLSEQQRVADQQAQLRNQQQQYNKQLDQQRYENELAKYGKEVGARGNLQNLAGQQAERTGNMYGQIGTGLGEMIGGISKLGSAPSPTPTTATTPSTGTMQNMQFKSPDVNEYLNALRRGTGNK